MQNLYLFSRSDSQAMRSGEDWVEPEDIEEDGYPIDYNITSSPNDFNVKTLFDFIESGTMKIPGFQRNYVWDKKRASRLIESIIMGLPIPQLFFYERGRNQFLVIDGQQRLMTVYYFIKGRFPRDEKRAEIRRYVDEKGNIPSYVLSDDQYFTDFSLDLALRYSDVKNRLNRQTISTLNQDDKATFLLRAIRCIFIKQHEPEGHSSMYEIFHRLNTGGINLTPQEIRGSLYQSEFYSMITRANLDERWRRLTTPDPDMRMKDIEILLRGFAMLLDGDNYQGAMIRFLNNFSEKAKLYDKKQVAYLESLFRMFLQKSEKLPSDSFELQSGRFSASMFEAIFTAACDSAVQNKDVSVKGIDPDDLAALKNDDEFMKASRYRTVAKENVATRVRKAKEVLFS